MTSASEVFVQLNEGILEAIPTAIPCVGFASIDGNAAGRIAGSVNLLS